MARYDREQAAETRDVQTSLPFPQPIQDGFLSERDYVGSGDNDKVSGSPDRSQLGRGARERSIALRGSEVATLTDIGTFRALAVEDLTRYRYGGDQDLVRHDLQNLARYGLIQSRTIHPERTVYVSLTQAGNRAIASRQREKKPRQRLYNGFVKPREIGHDAALYRLYQHELQRIRNMGGKIDRVVLDYELKQSINRRLATLGSLPKSKQDQERYEIAAAHGLKVVNGKILLPDLRLEYEGPDQQIAKVDLELVTHHYHHKDLAAKAKAGFAMFVSAQGSARLRPAISDPEIMQDILSL
jgi:hypothetical protein